MNSNKLHKKSNTSVVSFLFLMAIILHRFANASWTTLQTTSEKANIKPKIASYYTRGLFRQTSLASEQQHQQQKQQQQEELFFDSKHFVDKKSNNIDVNHLESAAGSPGMLHHLIYELVQYKHIPRVSLLTCQQDNGNGSGLDGDGDVGNGSPSPTRQQQRKQTRTSINIDTLTILRSFFTGKDNRRRSRRPNKGHTIDGVNISSSFSSSEWPVHSRSRRSERGERRSSASDFQPKGVLIKILRIDLLINSYQASESFANKNKSNDGTMNASELLATFLRSEVLRQIVVLDLSCNIASRKVLEMASNKGLFNSSYHWLLIEDYTFNRQADDDDDDHEDSDVRNDSQQLLQDIPTTATVDTSNAALDPVPNATTRISSGDDKINRDGRKNNDNVKDDDDEVSDNKVFNSTDSKEKEEKEQKNILLIEEFLEKINININTELILAKRINEGPDSHSKRDYYMLYDVWNPGFQYGGSLNITHIGNFSPDNGLQLQPWYRQNTAIIRRMDMKHAYIRCMIVITNKNHLDNLEDYLTQQYDTHLDSMNRFNFALLSYVRDLFNFSMVMSRTPSWGYLKNGKFDGMIGALVRRQADIGGSPIFFRIERAKVIDYTTRTWIARPCFIFRHPRTIRTDQTEFLQPFANDVWILVAVVGAATITLLGVLTIVEQKIMQEGYSSDKSSVFQQQQQQSKINAIDVRNTKNQHNPLRKKTTMEVDIEVSPFTQKDTMPLARLGFLRDAAAWFANTEGRKSDETTTNTISNSNKNAITLRKERFNIKAVGGIGIGRKKGQVPMDYGQGVASSVLEQSEIDCIDNGVRVSGPINAVVSLNNHGHSETGGSLKMGKSLKKYFSLWMKYFCKTDGNISNKKRWEIMLESMLFYIGSICQQGLSLSTNLLSCRCVIITSLLFSYCIYQFYSASIVGTQLMEKPKTIKTLRDLVHSSLEIGIEDIVYNRDFFLHTKDPDAIQLYASVSLPPDQNSSAASDNGSQTSAEQQQQRKKIDPITATASNHRKRVQSKTSEASNWHDPEYGVAKIKQGGFAFHVDVATAYKIISDTFKEKEICDLSEIQLFPPQKMVNIVQKGSPLKKIITYGLRRSTEAGLMDYQRKVWHSPKPRCVKQIQTDDLRVDMQTFTSAVFVLIFGFAASIVVLALEMVHNNLWQQFAT
ncbi:uncharacterized protein LOC129912615 [Episyrphus balteatus]|uniref:uncharacterized protein LOC129912615 n=1 Tax=Episyrphus balteatus TaxID=286459 RepID=UPI0024869D7B|nr:uncharacterized protein LOC129912615 [Episyrphus balteatus]